jgi:hypothetical protein
MTREERIQELAQLVAEKTLLVLEVRKAQPGSDRVKALNQMIETWRRELRRLRSGHEPSQEAEKPQGLTIVRGGLARG